MSPSKRSKNRPSQKAVRRNRPKLSKGTIKQLRSRIGVHDDELWADIRRNAREICEDMGLKLCMGKGDKKGWKSVDISVRISACKKVISFSDVLMTHCS